MSVPGYEEKVPEKVRETNTQKLQARKDPLSACERMFGSLLDLLVPAASLESSTIFWSLWSLRQKTLKDPF